MQSFWIEGIIQTYMIVDGTFAVAREIPVGVVCHVDNRWNLVA